MPFSPFIQKDGQICCTQELRSNCILRHIIEEKIEGNIEVEEEDVNSYRIMTEKRECTVVSKSSR